MKINWHGVNHDGFRRMIEGFHFAAIEKLRTFEPKKPGWTTARKGGKLTATIAEAIAKLDGLNVELNTRLATRGGDANPRLHRIRLNYRLHDKHPTELIATYGHELAHIVASLLYNFRVGHSEEWKAIARHLGVSDARCHAMDVSEFARKRPTYSYTCACDRKVWSLKAGRHARAQRALATTGRTPYYCPACKKYLEPTGDSL